jgi:hypothetical protein
VVAWEVPRNLGWSRTECPFSLALTLVNERQKEDRHHEQ